MEMMVVDNFCLAILHHIQTLQEFCEQKTNKNASKLFKTSDFIECDRKLLLHILKVDSLWSKETEVFDACIHGVTYNR